MKTKIHIELSKEQLISIIACIEGMIDNLEDEKVSILDAEEYDSVSFNLSNSEILELEEIKEIIQGAIK